MTGLYRVLQAAGILAVVLGGVGFYLFATTPAIFLEHRDPHPGGSASGLTEDLLPLVTAGSPVVSFPAAPPASKPQPAAAKRSGLWIEAPDLQIALPVRAGDGSNRIPGWVALVYPGTSSPGAPGNSYIYAHGYWEMFGGLLYARAGDRVSLRDYTTGTIQDFHISRVVGRTLATDSSWIHVASPKPLLTLQTCVDNRPNSDRYIVQAIPD